MITPTPTPPIVYDKRSHSIAYNMHLRQELPGALARVPR
jgi:hypothetical protein